MYGKRATPALSERRQLDLLDLLAEQADSIVGPEADNDDGVETDEREQSALDDEDSRGREEDV